MTYVYFEDQFHTPSCPPQPFKIDSEKLSIPPGKLKPTGKQRVRFTEEPILQSQYHTISFFKFPFTAIGRVCSKFKKHTNTYTYGTGFMIGPNQVLTSANNIIDFS